MRQMAVVCLFLAVVAGIGRAAETKEEASVAQPRDCWLKTPTVSVMTGFIYEPLEPYTIQQWMENLGDQFDAGQWVKDFKEADAAARMRSMSSAPAKSAPMSLTVVSRCCKILQQTRTSVAYTRVRPVLRVIWDLEDDPREASSTLPSTMLRPKRSTTS